MAALSERGFNFENSSRPNETLVPQFAYPSIVFGSFPAPNFLRETLAAYSATRPRAKFGPGRSQLERVVTLKAA